ncbi:hypothetical protein T484DRAFT_1846845, partial [Baffinella frigidus]
KPADASSELKLRTNYFLALFERRFLMELSKAKGQDKDVEVLALLNALVDDAFVVLNRPEWPAAEFLLKSVSDKLERCLAGERKFLLKSVSDKLERCLAGERKVPDARRAGIIDACGSIYTRLTKIKVAAQRDAEPTVPSSVSGATAKSSGVATATALAVDDLVDAVWPEKANDGKLHYYPASVTQVRAKSGKEEVCVKWDDAGGFAATIWLPRHQVP